MRVTFNKISQEESESAVINAYEHTSSIDTAIGLLENGEQIIVGFRDGEKVPCRLSQIYYFESVDDKCFAYYDLNFGDFLFGFDKNDKIIIITLKGDFFKISFDTKNGGNCKLIESKKLFA